jgi:formylglycine-generating enzyme required for sulfatase activity
VRKTKTKQDHIFLSVFEPKETTASAEEENKKSPQQSHGQTEGDSPCPISDISTMLSEHASPATAPLIVPEVIPAAPMDDTIAFESPETPRESSFALPTGETFPSSPSVTSAPAHMSDSIPSSEQIEAHAPEDASASLLPVQTGPSPETSTTVMPVPDPVISPPLPEPFRPVLPQFSFVYISPGSFVMGSPEHEPGRSADETPHQVTLARGFWIQTVPITQRAWQSVMGANPSRFQDEDADLPLENASWFDSQRFIERLNTLDKHTYRLPTEAEWEYACRAGSTAPCPAGEVMELYCGYDENLDSLGWYCGNSGRTTHPAGQKNPNPWGLYDMLGNVFEWCQDWYAEYPPAPQQDPIGPITGPGRVIRGGSWFSNARNCRSASRFSRPPDSKSDLVGFRLIREKKP